MPGKSKLKFKKRKPSGTFRSKNKSKAPLDPGTRMLQKYMGKGSFSNFVSNQPFPDRRNVKLSYRQIVQLATSNATSLFGTQQAFSLNSLYDPDYTGGGHQPYGFDQLTQIYQRYKVNGVHIKLRFFDPTDDGVVVAAVLAGTPAIALNIAGTDCLGGAVQERPFAVSRYITTSGSQSVVFEQYVPIWAVLNWSKLAYRLDMDNTTGPSNGDPGLLPRLYIAVASSRNSATAYVQCDVELTYYATMYTRIHIAQS